MTGILEEKARLRGEALARREALAPEERERASARVVEALAPLLKPGETVALFWPIRGEIDTRPLIPRIEALGGRIALPVVFAGAMTFHLFAGEGELRAAPFGLLQPPPDALRLDPDLVVVPLAAFDRRGGRIGYGKGYYDRTIAEMRDRGRHPRLLGVAYAVQEVDAVPFAPHDVALPLILTEREAIAAA